MRRVRKNLCRTSKGRFARCRSGGKGKRSGSCKFGVNKRTGRCLKRPRGC